MVPSQATHSHKHMYRLGVYLMQNITHWSHGFITELHV